MRAGAARRPLAAVLAAACMLAGGCRPSEEGGEQPSADGAQGAVPPSSALDRAEGSAASGDSAELWRFPDIGGELPDAVLADGMEIFTVTVVDAAGEPVPNLVINLEYEGSNEGPFTLGDALTGPDGSVPRRAYPAQYSLLVSDRRMLDYSGATLRNQMVFPLEIVEDGDNDQCVVWEYPTPNQLDREAEDKITLRFVDEDGLALAGVWVSLSLADSPLAVGQIVPGYTDADGCAYWLHYETGHYALGAVRGDGLASTMDSFELEVEADRLEYEFVWTGQSW